MIYNCYVIRTNKDPIKSFKSSYENIEIDVIFLNPKTFSGAHMRRYHNVFCDSHFQDDKEGQNIIKQVIKPLASFDASKFTFI